MKIIQKIFNKQNKLLNGKWYKNIFVSITLWAWALITLTLLIFIVGTLPHQRQVLEDRMKSEANDIAASIGQVTATAIINNDYGFTVDHCLKIIQQSNTILYITIVRNDGFALVFTAGSWRMDNLKDNLNLPNSKVAESQFVYSSLVHQEVFHYSFPFSYSQIDWGRINVGMSLKKFNQNAYDLYFRTFILALISIFVGLIASILFAKKITGPIRQLDIISQTVAAGNLNAKVNITSENELGRLALSFNKMTESLKNSQDNLERKVEERTSELEKINKVLQVEINERMQAENRLKQYNSRLEALDKIYRGIISAQSVDKIIMETLTNLDKLFPFISKTIVALFNDNNSDVSIFCNSFKGGDCNGEKNLNISAKRKLELFAQPSNRNYYIVNDLSSLNNKSAFEEKLFEMGIRSYISSPLTIDEKIIGFINISADSLNPFTEENKEILAVVSNQLAVAVYQAQLQSKIHEHTQDLQNSLREKEVLLKEIHHRVKNNLQVISSLLYLNSKKIMDKETRDMFKDSQNRVKSIALVHERLYQSKDLGRIDFKEYVRKLTNDLFRSYTVNQSDVKLSLDINDIYISIDTAVPCGLIINELVSNSFKYAFPEGPNKERENEIKINFNKNYNNELVLEISDNGIGLPEGLNLKKSESLGLQLVDTLIAQLEGNVEVRQNGGAFFKFTFKDLTK